MADCDVLVIGAGSAGCVLANRLSEDSSRKVVVLESGTTVDDPDMRRPDRWPFNYGRSYDWAYWTSPQVGLDGRRLDWPRGKGVGGSSLLHAMAHMRGSRSDFAAWVEATGDDRWSWERLLPFFKRTEHFSGGADAVHADDGPLPVLLPGPESTSPLVRSYLDAWEALGVPRIPDHNGGEMLGATQNSLTIRDGERVTVSDAYLDPVRHRENLRLVDRATVHILRIEGSRVIGARYERDGRLEDVSCDAVILAAGSIADPLLLMRSGVGDPAVLRAAGVEVAHELPEVGRNLHDHLLGAGNLYRSSRVVPPSRLQLSESMTYLSADGPEAVAGAADVVVGCVVGPSASERYLSALEGLAPGEAYTLLFGVTHPTSRGSLTITGPDVEDAPHIDPRYLDTEHDRRMFRVALDYARAVGGSAQMSGWRGSEILPGPGCTSVAEIDEFIRGAAITHHHPTGTLRMGRTDDAPVTPDLRLRGIDNCYAVDASVIPSITTGPIHACVLAIAESFADRFVS